MYEKICVYLMKKRHYVLKSQQRKQTQHIGARIVAQKQFRKMKIYNNKYDLTCK